jgi:hypothetical protein
MNCVENTDKTFSVVNAEDIVLDAWTPVPSHGPLKKLQDLPEFGH